MNSIKNPILKVFANDPRYWLKWICCVFGCSRAEFSQAIFDEALKLEVIASKPNVVAIITEEFPTLAKRSARSELSSNKIRSTFGIDRLDVCLVSDRR
jgi:dTDP-4-dehydrorhamnose reductase